MVGWYSCWRVIPVPAFCTHAVLEVGREGEVVQESGEEPDVVEDDADVGEGQPGTVQAGHRRLRVQLGAKAVVQLLVQSGRLVHLPHLPLGQARPADTQTVETLVTLVKRDVCSSWSAGNFFK